MGLEDKSGDDLDLDLDTNQVPTGGVVLDKTNIVGKEELGGKETPGGEDYCSRNGALMIWFRNEVFHFPVK